MRPDPLAEPCRATTASAGRQGEALETLLYIQFDIRMRSSISRSRSLRRA
jgi:hypothetical protein